MDRKDTYMTVGCLCIMAATEFLEKRFICVPVVFTVVTITCFVKAAGILIKETRREAEWKNGSWRRRGPEY